MIELGDSWFKMLYHILFQNSSCVYIKQLITLRMPLFLNHFSFVVSMLSAVLPSDNYLGGLIQ